MHHVFSLKRFSIFIIFSGCENNRREDVGDKAKKVKQKLLEEMLRQKHELERKQAERQKVKAELLFSWAPEHFILIWQIFHVLKFCLATIFWSLPRVVVWCSLCYSFQKDSTVIFGLLAGLNFLQLRQIWVGVPSKLSIFHYFFSISISLGGVLTWLKYCWLGLYNHATSR